MTWKFSDDKPIYLQIATQIEHKILTGNYPVGSKLASVRDLAAQAQVNPNTMQKAFAELERKGIVYSSRTSGRFVTEDKDVVKQRKKETASYYVSDFLNRMAEIGYDKEGSLEIIRNFKEES